MPLAPSRALHPTFLLESSPDLGHRVVARGIEVLVEHNVTQLHEWEKPVEDSVVSTCSVPSTSATRCCYLQSAMWYCPVAQFRNGALCLQTEAALIQHSTCDGRHDYGCAIAKLVLPELVGASTVTPSGRSVSLTMSASLNVLMS